MSELSLRERIAELERRGLANDPKVAPALERMRADLARQEAPTPSPTAARRAATDYSFTPKDPVEQAFLDDVTARNRQNTDSLISQLTGRPIQTELKRFPSGDVYEVNGETLFPRNRSREARMEDFLDDYLPFGAKTLAGIGEGFRSTFDTTADAANSATLRGGDDIAGFVVDALTGTTAGSDWAQQTNDFGEAVWQNDRNSALAQTAGVATGALYAPTQVANLLARAPGAVGRFAGGTLAGRVASNAAGGAVAIQGAAQGDGNLDQRYAKEVLDTDIGALGALVGRPVETGVDLRTGVPALAGGLTAAIPAVAAGLGAISRTADQFTDAGQARIADRMIRSDIEQGGTSIDDIRAADGGEFRVADLNSQTRRRAGSASRLGGEQAARLRDDLEARGETRATRMREDFADALDVPASVRDDPYSGAKAYADQIDADRSRKSAERGYRSMSGLRISEEQVPFDQTPAPRGLPDDYTFRDAAEDLVADAEGMGLRSKADLLETGMQGAQRAGLRDDLRPIPEDGGRSGLARHTTEELKELLSNRGLPRTRNDDPTLGPVTRSEQHPDAPKELTDGGRRTILRTLRLRDRQQGLPSENAPPVSVSRVRALKTAANDAAEAAGQAGERATAKAFRDFAGRARAILAEGVRGQNNVRQSLIGDEYFTALSRALDAFELSSGIRAGDGARSGGGLFRATPEQLTRFVDDLNRFRRDIVGDTRLHPDTRRNLLAEFDRAFEAFRVGAVRAYADFLQSNPVSRNARVFNEDGPAMQARLRTLFNSDDDLQAYLRTVEREGVMQATEREVLAGSQTASRSAADDELISESGGVRVAPDVLNILREAANVFVFRIVGSRLQNFSERVLQGMTTRVADKLARQLNRTDLNALADELEAAQLAGRDPDIARLPARVQGRMQVAVNEEVRAAQGGATPTDDPSPAIGPTRKPGAPINARDKSNLERVAWREHTENDFKTHNEMVDHLAKLPRKRVNMSKSTIKKHTKDLWDDIVELRGGKPDRQPDLDESEDALPPSTPPQEAIGFYQTPAGGRLGDQVRRYDRDLKQMDRDLQNFGRRADSDDPASRAFGRKEEEILPDNIYLRDAVASQGREYLSDANRARKLYDQLPENMRADTEGADLGSREILRDIRQRRFETEAEGRAANLLVRDYDVQMVDRGGMSPDRSVDADFTPMSDGTARLRFDRALADAYRRGTFQTPQQFRRGTIDEEIAHAMLDRGIFTKGEMTILLREAKRFEIKSRTRDKIDYMRGYKEAFKKRGYADDEYTRRLNNEYIAKYFARGGHRLLRSSTLQRIYDKIVDFLEAVSGIKFTHSAPGLSERFASPGANGLLPLRNLRQTELVRRARARVSQRERARQGGR